MRKAEETDFCSALILVNCQLTLQFKIQAQACM